MSVVVIAFHVVGILISVAHGVLSYDIKKQNERMHEEHMAHICYQRSIEDGNDLFYEGEQVEYEDFDM